LQVPSGDAAPPAYQRKKSKKKVQPQVTADAVAEKENGLRLGVDEPTNKKRSRDEPDSTVIIGEVGGQRTKRTRKDKVLADKSTAEPEDSPPGKKIATKGGNLKKKKMRYVASDAMTRLTTHRA
jgi:hypothetical protein